MLSPPPSRQPRRIAAVGAQAPDPHLTNRVTISNFEIRKFEFELFLFVFFGKQFTRPEEGSFSFFFRETWSVVLQPPSVSFFGWSIAY
jgi:hypothetical protein